VQVWRLCHARYASTAYSGEGAREFGGRWNRPGRAVVYTSSTLSLALLENLVHFDVEELPDEYVAVAAYIPDEAPIQILEPGALPKSWREIGAPEVLRDNGEAWLQAKRFLVLRVPSVVVPEEFNYLVNPNHPDFASIKVARAKSFTFDPRLWK
jgi:RES domain-containing protein